MKTNPFFSIIIVTFNSEKTLEKCFNSLFSQTFLNWELLVIDGQSTDKTVKIINKHLSKIDYFVSEKDSGIYDAMNKGARQARGKFLYFLNSDDEFFDSLVLEDVFNSIDNNTDLITANVLKIYEKKSILKKTRLIRINLLLGMMPPHQSMFLRKNAFNMVGGFSTKYRSSGDFDLCCKLFEKEVSCKRINRNIAFFKAGGMSANKKIAYKELFEIVKGHFGLFWGHFFYFRKIILEQGLKKIIFFYQLN